MWMTLKAHFEVSNPEGLKITEEPGLLRLSRIITFLMIFLMFVVYVVFNPTGYFLYLTNWGIFLSGSYYVTLYLSHKKPSLRSISILLLHACWCIELSLSIVFWVAIYPYITDSAWNWFLYLIAVPPHGLYCIGLGLELRYTYVMCKREWVSLPIGIVLLYSFVNVPYTLAVKALYPKVDYMSAWSYLVVVMLLILILISSEVAYQLTKRRQEFFVKDISTNTLLVYQHPI
jgi:hypothetical protein